ncbi:peptidase [Shewanella sp. Scap07]|uniref:S41 family peptidase n=1 Tax=Shewanella sp. Scap07 TaxID=2589987 RepID=UPI0015BE6CB9|nr:S41 family peptidase [Shewanella sp. Scap07]QLE86286.1 peptidase [Shewanella sp. Scap07]
MTLLQKKTLCTAAVLSCLALTACSGGGSTSAETNTDNTGSIGTGGSGTGSGNNSSTEWVAGDFTPYTQLANQCSADQTGSAMTEKLWLRSWSDDTYLWYSEILDQDPAPYTVAEYFSVLMTQELTASGKPKDNPNFHYSIPTDIWEQQSQSGASFGYGFEIVIQPASNQQERKVSVAYSEPNTPASSANIQRGAVIVAIDGVNVASANSDSELAVLTNGLFPNQSGQQAEFLVRDLGSVNNRTITLTAQTVVSTPVQQTQVIDTATGKVGYVLFNSHIAPAERGLYDAISTLSQAGIDDLVLDLRYNGGGLLAMASQLSYMIAGEQATIDRIFERTSFNDKYPNTNPVTGEPLTSMPFITESIGFNTGLLSAGLNLPVLDLPRVFVLTSNGTCSASEAIMNGLRGIDIEVIQIGATTCGKPYGFYPTPNCGTTYFTIQFQGENNKGFGEYSDGFAAVSNPTLPSELPGCDVADDLTHDFGDTNEGMLSAALYYRDNGQCPISIASSAPQLSNTVQSIDTSLKIEDTRQQNFWKSNRIVNNMGSQ